MTFRKLGNFTSETKLQNAIISALEQVDVWVIRTARSKKRGRHSINTGEDGQPDLWTEFGWIEVKLPGKDLDPDQVIWHEKAKNRGVPAGVARSISDAFALVAEWRPKKSPPATRR